MTTSRITHLEGVVKDLETRLEAAKNRSNENWNLAVEQKQRAEKAAQKLCDIRAYAHNSERVTWRMQRIKAILEDK